MRTDVAIVGAGLFGSSLAVELAREGMRVGLHDKSTPASGDTGRSFGMVRAHYSNEVTVRLAKRGIELLAGDPRSGYVRTGYMLPVAERDLAACAANVELGRSLVSTRACSSRRRSPRSSRRFAWAASPPPPTSLTADSSIRDA